MRPKIRIESKYLGIKCAKRVSLRENILQERIPGDKMSGNKIFINHCRAFWGECKYKKAWRQKTTKTKSTETKSPEINCQTAIDRAWVILNDERNHAEICLIDCLSHE